MTEKEKKTRYRKMRRLWKAGHRAKAIARSFCLNVWLVYKVLKKKR